MKSRLLNLLWVLLVLPAAALAQEEEKNPYLPNVTLDFTYGTRYMWYGYDVLDDRGAFQPSVTLDWSGFYVGLWASIADESGMVDSDEMDYYFGYATTFFEEESYALSADLSYYYYDYYHSESESGIDGVADAQQILLILSLPNLIPIGPSNLVPSYEITYVWPGFQGSTDEWLSGWVHQPGVSYSLPIGNAWFPEQTLDLGWSISYNDGMYGSDSGWSHMTFSVSTEIAYRGIGFVPALYYQESFEDTVNDEDEWYGTFSLSYSF